MKYIDAILQYLNNEQSEDERRKFSRLIETDTEVQEELAQVLKAIKLIEDRLKIKGPETIDKDELIAEICALSDVSGFKEMPLDNRIKTLKKKLDAIRYGKTVKRNPGKWNRGFLFLAAASVTLLFVMLFRVPDESGIYHKYYHPEQDQCLRMFARAHSEEDLALIQFLNGQLSESKEYFSRIVTSGNALSKDSLLLGITLYETGERDRAKELLSELTNSNSGVYNYAARWYLALYSIQSGDFNLAIELLTGLSEQDCLYTKDAKAIIKDLKKENRGILKTKNTN